jgi:hypothetical protein
VEGSQALLVAAHEEVDSLRRQLDQARADSAEQEELAAAALQALAEDSRAEQSEAAVASAEAAATASADALLGRSVLKDLLSASAVRLSCTEARLHTSQEIVNRDLEQRLQENVEQNNEMSTALYQLTEEAAARDQEMEDLTQQLIESKMQHAADSLQWGHERSGEVKKAQTPERNKEFVNSPYSPASTV